MQRTFPLVPKSNSKLMPGDFWGFNFAPNKFAAGRVIELPWQHGERDRRSFLAALMDWSGVAPPNSQDIAGRKVLAQGSMHIRAFSFSGWAIDGNLDLVGDNLKPWMFRTAEFTRFVRVGLNKERLGTAEELLNSPVYGGWGMTYIVELARHRFRHN